MTKVVLFGHGGSGNRGCEAIIRGTSSIIKKNVEDANITVVSNRAYEDVNAKIDTIDHLESSKMLTRYTPIWVANVLTRRFLKPDYVWHYLYKSIFKVAEDSDICMSIGGDNYCYGKPRSQYYINRKIKRLNKKLVFWGASVEPDAIDREMADDLNSCDLKIVRESITYQALLDNGIKENVFLHSDPAFTMERQEVEMPNGWEDGAMVGINISPMVARYGQEESLNAATNSLIQHILDSSEYKVCLVPHVFWKNKNDYQYMQKFYNEFKDTGRVILVGENYNSPQTKYIISKCRSLIASRTHATIAGYSTCVPTAAIGYSVKAKGIARDIFGTEKDFVLPVQTLANANDLIMAFDKLNERESDLKKYLEEKMPDYKKSAWDAGDRLKSLI